MNLSPTHTISYTVGFLSGFLCAFVLLNYRMLTEPRRVQCDGGEGCTPPPDPDWDKILEDLMSDRGVDE